MCKSLYERILAGAAEKCEHNNKALYIVKMLINRESLGDFECVLQYPGVVACWIYVDGFIKAQHQWSHMSMFHSGGKSSITIIALFISP